MLDITPILAPRLVWGSCFERVRRLLGWPASAVENMPSYECNDFNHAKADQHEGFECPVFTRFRRAEIQARAFLQASGKIK